MKLYRLENAMMFSILLNIFVFMILGLKKIMMYITSLKMNFLDLSEVSKSIKNADLSIWLYITVAILIINLVAVIVFGISKNERMTAHKTRALRNYCSKRLTDDDEEERKSVIKYNKIVKTMILNFNDDECIFTLKLNKLEDEKIINKDIDNIIDAVRRIVTDYNFGDYQSCKMIGYKIK